MTHDLTLIIGHQRDDRGCLSLKARHQFGFGGSLEGGVMDPPNSIFCQLVVLLESAPQLNDILHERVAAAKATANTAGIVASYPRPCDRETAYDHSDARE